MLECRCVAGMRRPPLPMTAASSISQSSCEVSGGILVASPGPITVFRNLMNMYGLLSDLAGEHASHLVRVLDVIGGGTEDAVGAKRSGQLACAIRHRT